jgi:molybdenum cofactor cytidylyltransferase
LSDFDAVTVVLLAAGLSRRFGPGDKLEQLVGGKPLAFHSGETLAGLPFGWKFAVCSAPDGIVPDRLRALGFEIVVNPDPACGQGSSLALGAEAVERTGAAGVLICLADMPAVGRVLLDGIVEHWATDRTKTVAAHGPDYLGPPALFPCAALPALRAIVGDRGAKYLLTEAIPVAAGSAELRDYDLPADFR